jgi:cephalosporin hydroxylase
MSYADIPGHSGFLWLYDEAIRHFPSGSLFVEVGVALGHSIAYLAEEAAKAGKTFELHAVDPWAGTQRNGEQQQWADKAAGGDFGLFCQMMVAHSPASLAVIKPFRMTSFEYVDLHTEIGGLLRPSLVLLDGDHSYETVRDEIDCYGPILARGGWLAGDDYDTVNGLGVMKAVDEAFGKRVEIRGNTWVVR